MGTGKYQGMLGSFHVRLADNPKIEFDLSGMDDKVRKNYLSTHPLGTIVTFKYQGLTDDQKPRNLSYLRIRESPSKPMLDRDLFSNLLKVAGMRKQQLAKESTITTQKRELQISGGALLMAAKIVSKMPDQLIEIPGGLEGVSGIGRGTIRRANELLNTGKLSELSDSQELLYQTELLSIAGIGPTLAQELVNQGITSIKDLKDKVKSKKIKLSPQQLVGLKYHDDLQQKIPFDEVEDIGQAINKLAIKIDSNNITSTVGSHRRRKSFSGDIDILLTNKKGQNTLADLLEQLPSLVATFSQGSTKYAGVYRKRKETARHLDIRYIDYDNYYPALLHSTGGAQFNKNMRTEAIKKGYKLSEFGLFDRKTNKRIPINSEEEIFKKLDLPYVKPDNR